MLKNLSKTGKLLLLTSLLIPVFTIVTFGQPKTYKIISVKSDGVIPNRSGGYIISGNPPSQFSNFSNFTFEYVRYSRNIVGNTVVGAVNVDRTVKESANLYQITELSFIGNKIIFKTEELNNIHYEFNGSYLKKGDLVRYNRKKTVVLEGTLSKIIAGVKNTEAKMHFLYVIWEAPYYVPPKQ